MRYSLLSLVLGLAAVPSAIAQQLDIAVMDGGMPGGGTGDPQCIQVCNVIFHDVEGCSGTASWVDTCLSNLNDLPTDSRSVDGCAVAWVSNAGGNVPGISITSSGGEAYYQIYSCPDGGDLGGGVGNQCAPTDGACQGGVF